MMDARTSSGDLLRIALTQTRNAYQHMPESVADVARLAGELDAIRAANIDHNEALIRLAASQGSRIVGLGELFPGPYFALDEDPMWLDAAEDAETGPSVRRMREVARELAVVIVAPIYEIESGSGHRYNTAVVIDADGAVLGKYRKTHIPDGQNERASFREAFYYEPSRGLPIQHARGATGGNPFFPVFTTRHARIGVAICYDRHFDGAMFSLAREGAQVIFVPAVTFGAKSERMWQHEFQVDATRHNVFVAGSNRIGVEPPWDTRYFGQSYVTGPNGRLADRSTHDRVIISDIDLGDLQRDDPSGWNLQRDLRDPIYSKRLTR